MNIAEAILRSITTDSTVEVETTCETQYEDYLGDLLVEADDIVSHREGVDAWGFDGKWEWRIHLLIPSRDYLGQDERDEVDADAQDRADAQDEQEQEHRQDPATSAHPEAHDGAGKQWLVMVDEDLLRVEPVTWSVALGLREEAREARPGATVAIYRDQISEIF